MILLTSIVQGFGFGLGILGAIVVMCFVTPLIELVIDRLGSSKEKGSQDGS